MDTDQKFPVTPGTWTVGKGGTVVTDQVNPQAIKSGRQTADERHYYGGYLIAESLVCEADAQLIAAAPDLLAALKDLMNVAVWDDDYTTKADFMVVFKAAEAAVAKAEGGAA